MAGHMAGGPLRSVTRAGTAANRSGAAMASISAPARRDEEYQLSVDDWEWVRRTAESLGPLTGRLRHILGLLLRVRCSDPAAVAAIQPARCRQESTGGWASR